MKKNNEEMKNTIEKIKENNKKILGILREMVDDDKKK